MKVTRAEQSPLEIRNKLCRFLIVQIPRCLKIVQQEETTANERSEQQIAIGRVALNIDGEERNGFVERSYATRKVHGTC